MKKKLENQVEGDILFTWEYKPPKHKKILYSLVPVIIIGIWSTISIFWKRAKFLDSALTAILFAIIAFTMKAFKAQEYRLTTRGVYAFDPNKKKWQRLGYWNEFTDYERGEEYIKLIKKRWFDKKCIYFNQKSEDYLKILSVINQNIFRGA